MIELLNEKFVNAWVVIPQLDAIEKSFSTEAARRIAAIAKAAYTYPVDSLAITPEGKVVAQLSVNELFERFAEGSRPYVAFLEKGLEAADE